MKIMYEIHYQYHPVGQGCFYTGELTGRNGRLFNFVYDCGTVSEQEYLTEAIDTYPVKIEPGKINVCMISHFHKDHVSGIPRLLKGKECDRLVIPYYNPLERLIVYLQSEDTEDEDYRSMMQDPYSYFSGDGYSIGRIIVVGGGANTNEIREGRPFAPEPEGSGGNPEEQEASADIEYFDEWQQDDENEVFFSQLKLENPEADTSKVEVKQIPYQLRTAVYKFVFYCRTMEGGSDVDYIAKIKELRKQIDDYVAAKKTEPRYKSLTFKDLFYAPHINEIKKIYGRVFGPNNLNGTSLAVYHQTTLRPQNYIGHQLYPFRFPRMIVDGDAKGSLMTGDLDLENKEKLMLFQDYYRHHIPSTGVFQVMHHGSDKNWPFGITQSRLHTFPAYVVNHGAGRAHHPGKEVSKLLHKENPRHVYLNNEFTPIHYGYYFTVRS